MKPTLILAALLAVAVPACQTTSTGPTDDHSGHDHSGHDHSGHDHSSHTNAQTSAKPQSLQAGVKAYPLAICVVSNEPLGEWDEETTYVYGEQEMKFCCKMCLKKFKKSPEKYLAKLP